MRTLISARRYEARRINELEMFDYQIVCSWMLLNDDAKNKMKNEKQKQ